MQVGTDPDLHFQKEISMLKNTLSLRIWLVIISTVLALGTSCAPSGTLVKIEPSVSMVQVNDTFKVPVKVQNVANLTAIELHLSFNTTALEVVSLTNGGFIKADFSLQNTFDNAAGTIDYAVAQINDPPANGNGTLLEIVFRAKADGESPIRFRKTQAAPAGILLSDSKGTAIQILLTDGSVSVR
jgi:Cohesin domain